MFYLNYFFHLSDLYWKMLASQQTNQNSPFHSWLICHVIKYYLYYPSHMIDNHGYIKTQSNLKKLSMGLYKKILPVLDPQFVIYCVLPEKIFALSMEGFVRLSTTSLGLQKFQLIFALSFKMFVFWDSPLLPMTFHVLGMGIFWKYTFCNHFETLFPKFSFFLSKFRSLLEKLFIVDTFLKINLKAFQGMIAFLKFRQHWQEVEGGGLKVSVIKVLKVLWPSPASLKFVHMP